MEPTNRKYLPTFSDLIDRLTICLQKQIFIKDHTHEYKKEIEDIMHDLNLMIESQNIILTGEMVRAICAIMLTNRYIWENESKARNGDSQDLELLKLTHSINGVRNLAKNIISNELNERVDLKIDCFASELIEKYGNWNIFSTAKEDIKIESDKKVREYINKKMDLAYEKPEPVWYKKQGAFTFKELIVLKTWNEIDKIIYSSYTAETIEEAVEEAVIKNISLRWIDLHGANLIGSYLQGADLVGANLRGANLRGANLRRTYLNSTNLCEADLRGAHLRGANLYGANLQGAKFSISREELTKIAGNVNKTYIDNTTQFNVELNEPETFEDDIEDDIDFKLMDKINKTSTTFESDTGHTTVVLPRQYNLEDKDFDDYLPPYVYNKLTNNLLGRWRKTDSRMDYHVHTSATTIFRSKPFFTVEVQFMKS